MLCVYRDRKRKRFVGQTGREANVKKIKTESGQRISASYKTQLYQQWRERHKIDSLTAGGEEGENCGGVGEGRGGRGGRGRGGRGRGGRGRVLKGRGGDGKTQTVGDLKTNDQILKKRKKKAFQTARRSKKQQGRTPTRGRGRGRGKPRN